MRMLSCSGLLCVADYVWKAELGTAVGIFLPVLFREESCHPKYEVQRLSEGLGGPEKQEDR